VSPSASFPADTSSAQAGLWFLEKLLPDSAAGTVSRVYRVTGTLDVGALRTAWHALVTRHDALRTTLAQRNGRVVAHIAAPGDAVDSFAAPGSGHRALSLADGPLATLTVADHEVVLTVHRAVVDDESLSILLRELAATYAAVRSGRFEPAPGPATKHTDFARWERDHPATGRDLLDHWNPVPPALALPADRTRPSTPSATGGVVRFEWADARDSLTALCAAEGTTPDVVFLAAFVTLLARYAGTERLVVGVPRNIRPPEFDGVVGQFTNLVPHVADLAGRPTFRALVARTARQVADEHRELPFADVVRALHVERDARRIPLCDALFSYQETPEATFDLVGATVTREYSDTGDVAADLALTIDSPVAGSLSFRDCLFDRGSAEQIAAQLHTLLVAALTDPDLPVADLPLEGPHRLRASVGEADLIAAALQDARPAHDLFHAKARRWPDAVALTWGDTDITYAELEARAATVTAALTADGGVKDAPVLVRMATGPGQIAALLGVLDAGAHLVCLGQGNTGERGKAVLTDVRPTRMLLDIAPESDPLAQWYANELDGRVLGALEPDGPAPRTAVATGLAARAYVTYTSGSTGTPKGIPQTHATLAQFTTWFAREFRIGPGSRVAQWAAPGYDASLCEAFAALVAGAALCPVPDRIRPNPEKIVDWLAEQRITVFQTVPSFARQILRVLTSKGHAGKLPALEHLLLAGEALPGELANGLRAALPSVRLVNLYGPTESILATWHEISEPIHGTAPVGRSIPGRQVLVLDELDRPCPQGVTGHIVIRSPYLTSGYIGAAASDGFAFGMLESRPRYGITGGACYRTGDLGRRRWDGALEFRGRGDFQVKFNGIRLELTDIEAALTAHESVAECAVVAVTGPDGLVARLVGYVVPRRDDAGDAAGTADDWRSALRTRFGRSMPPLSFRTMIGLPRGIGGKVDRTLLPDPGPSSADATQPRRTGIEQDVAAIWAGLTGIQPVGAESFFASGGHSLLAIELLDEIHARFGVAVALPDLYADPSVPGLAALVEPHTVFLQVETGT
jgi:amino acid adenylation domain-containing protein